MTDTDRQLLRSVSAGSSLDALASPVLESAVFGPQRGPCPVPDAREAHGELGRGISPFLTFAVAGHRTPTALEQATFLDERVGTGVRVPVFDTVQLVDMLRDPLLRFFFVELLASYTRVSSGVAWRRTPRGWRRQRFNDLDPARLAGLLDVVSPEERPGVYRRLGDLSLFLLGVFPDHPPVPAGAATDLLLRHSGLPRDARTQLPGPALLERLGAGCYRAATRLATGAGSPLTGTLAVAGEIADRFLEARRILNAITDRYLFPLRSRWFPA